MFGRSGQMFPRRTFHDAIYEEEYGSDNEDECCRCRGLSAILCWFLSVIILVGLAATVVLTVFFILRSRTMMVKPNADLDVEMYGKDQNLFEANAAAGGGAASKELLGSSESSVETSGVEGGGSLNKRKKLNTKPNGRGPPDATKNDVDADVNEEQNTIIGSSDEDQAEDASISHPRNQHPNHHTHFNNGRHNRLQPYSPVKTTTTTSTTTTTTEAPAEASDEENNESSSEEEVENEQNNGEGSSLFNLFSGPRNPSYSTPSQHDEEEETETDDDDNGQGVISAEASAEFKSTRYHDGSPVQQVLFTESPKVTLTTPSPYRRNLQTTRFPMGRTSFSTTSTTEVPAPQEESEEEEGDGDDDAENQNDEDAEEHNDEHNNDEGDAHVPNHENEEEGSQEEGNDENHDDNNEDESHDHAHNEKSSEEESKVESTPFATPTTTSMYDQHSSEKEMGEMGSESGESQLKQMLLDSIPPHGDNKDEDQEHEDSGSSSNEPEGGASGSSEFNLSQNIHTTPTSTTTTTYKPSTTLKTVKPKSRQDTLSRLISRNFTRKSSSTTPETNGSEPETSTGSPTGTTLGPAGHKYDYTMTPVERTKLKTKSTESTEENVVTRAPPKFTRYRSTTTKPSASPGPPSTAAPRTRGTTTISSAEFGIKMGSKRGSVESPIDIVPSPDLSKGIEQIKAQPNSLEGVDLNSGSSEDHSKTSSEQQFLDVLVGSEDHKSLVTKKTEEGVVTSAILPPWYDPNGANSSISDVLSTNGTLLSNTVAKVEDETSREHTSFGRKTLGKKSSEENKDGSKEKSKENGGSEFDRLVSMFSKQEASSEEHTPPTQSRFGLKKITKPIILKKPGGSMNSKYIPQVPGRASLFPSSSSKESSKQIQSGENKSSTSPSPASPEAQSTNVEQTVTGDVGRTGALPTAADVEAALEADNERESGKSGESQHVENERLHSEENEDSNEEEDPSHVIDVNFDDVDENPAEIIIEQDSSLPTEDEDDGDFVEEDYPGYGENPPSMAMAGSEANHKVVPPPEEFTRGSGIRKPVSSEEDENDMEKSASEMERVNATTTTTTTTVAPAPPSTSSPPAAIRRPAYTREEILKSAVKPSPESIHRGDNSLHENHVDRLGGGSVEATSGEYEEYEDDNYEGGSVEQEEGHSLERWSSEKNGDGQRWSAPDQIMNTVPVNRQQFHRDEDENAENSAAESIAHPSVKPKPNTLDDDEGNSGNNSTGEGAFKAPPLVSFHENKLNFSPLTHDGEYHSKDGWRPVISGSKNQQSEESEPPPHEPQEGFFNGGSASVEPDSTQGGSYEIEQDEPEPESQIPLKQQQQQLFQEQLPPTLPPQHTFREPISPPPPQMYKDPVVSPPPQQQMVPMQPQQSHSHKWAQPDTTGASPPQPGQHDNKLKPIIPPPVPAVVKFPDSEEDHEDRHHHGRNRLRRPPQQHFDRAKYLTRPVPPPIVMRRHPQNSGPGPYSDGHGPKRPGPPPNPPRQQMVPQASQQNPQYAEPPPPLRQGRPQGPINRNFHMRPNPMRRFNFGGPPQAQPRSGGNIKWPTDDDGGSNRDNSMKNREGSRSEVSNNNKRRRRRRRAIGA